MPTPKGGKAWNSGTSKGWIDARGYRWLYVTENGKRVARREHRVIMERRLGRKLEPWEVVHHKDENPANNDISNLEVVEFGAHTGEHSKGRRKDADAKRSMEAFALMREELRRERALKADLLEALREARDALHQHYVDWDGEPEDAVPLQLARAKCETAIAKATAGETRNAEPIQSEGAR